MKHQKILRVAAITLALCLLLGLAGCGGTNSPATGTEPTAPGASTEPTTAPDSPSSGTDSPTANPVATTATPDSPTDEPVPAATSAPDGGSGLYVASSGGTGAGTDSGALLMDSGAIAPEAVGGYGGDVKAEYEMKAAAGTSLTIAEGEPREPAPGAAPDGELTVDPAFYGDEDTPELDPDPGWVEPGEAYVLTAAEWNDNDNWPFFTNLVNAGTIAFPSFGVDPRNRVKVTLLDADGAPLSGEAVELLDEAGSALWTARTNKTGEAFLFWHEGETPAAVTRDGELHPLTLRTEPGEGQQGAPVVTGAEDLVIRAEAEAPEKTLLQVMFIVDTTGSMSDELSYLQMDFSAIAGELDGHGIEWSACFYRDEGDEYVTRVSEFSADVAAIQALLASEYAAGGGDTPEAVDQILDETLRMDFVRDAGRRGWQEDAEKVAFLIFDAPPHYGTDATIDAAVRRAAEAGIRVIPVVASNADRETELFGRALAICTGGTYVFLTDDSGVGNSHLEPIVGPYTVEKLHDVIVRILSGYLV